MVDLSELISLLLRELTTQPQGSTREKGSLDTMTPTLEEVGTGGIDTMIDDLTTVVGIGTMIGTGRGRPGETMTITDDVMIESDETIDEMTGEMIDTNERDPSVRLVVNDEPEYRPLTKIEDPLIGIKMSLYLKVMLPQDTRYYLKTRL